ncbi:acyltransferase [Mycobacterium sp. SM1]|uniref:condensation domain-containing protein n=1 Tax=Mycobacterium sp. SM1 TaxID=2816243 RepID=UPI001BCE36C9|nr:condensation domain-containing protein [Mycobacterium sp. SM1]MBS4726892.1 acyltransferase [Mycobacterium sp. SM1]
MIAVGKVTVGPIRDWTPAPGSVVCWQPSPASLAAARRAPASAVPASYQQAQHLRRFGEYRSRGIDMSRLLTACWDVPGRCDIRAMTHVINAHLRRHDTYHSWFECSDTGGIVRRTIREPADIAYLPIRLGEITAADLRREALSTPNPLQWDSFRFMVIQRADHFTFCLCVDHVHIDAMFVGVAFAELHMMYAALVSGAAPLSLPAAGSYDAYCVRQHRELSALTLESQPVRSWVEFFDENNGTLPQFPLPVADEPVPCDMMGVRLLDERQTARFESACVAAGARFSGGVFACAALVEHELTGADTYYGIIPVDTRSTQAELMTTGWFVGFVPLTVPVGTSFAETVRAAQESFDSGKECARVPIDRILELAPWLRMPQRGAPLLFYLDAGVPPLSAFVTSQLEGMNAGLYHDGRIPSQVAIRVNRLENETQMIVLFPDDPVARESITRYLAAAKSVYVRVAEHGGAMRPQRHGAQPGHHVACRV